MTEEVTMVVRLMLAGLLGAVVGLQREKAGKSAGVRTLALICLGATLFTLISVFALEERDSFRIVANIVTGIGFLGAGAIIRREDEGMIEGLTTAATVWSVAAIGIAVGVGLYLVASVATIIVLIILISSRVIDKGSK